MELRTETTRQHFGYRYDCRAWMVTDDTFLSDCPQTNVRWRETATGRRISMTFRKVIIAG
jgi:riboflavin biosynthesis pyrimidine reductase